MRSKTTGGSVGTLLRAEANEDARYTGSLWSAKASRGGPRAALGRWWASSTDRDFLRSGDGRRAFWWALLPLPSLVGLVLDRSHADLVVLNSCTAIMLAMGGWIFSSFGMVELLWADVAVAGIYLAQVVAMYGSILFVAGECQPLMLPQVAACFAMVLAGVHSTVLAGFLGAVSVACPFFSAIQWQSQDAVACIYLLLGSVLVESRLAVLWSERQALRCGYKPLDTATGGYDCAADEVALRQSSWLSVRSAAVGPAVPAELQEYDPSRGEGSVAAAGSARGSSASSLLPERQERRWFSPADAPPRLSATCSASDEAVVPLRVHDEVSALGAARQHGVPPRRAQPSTASLGPRAPTAATPSSPSAAPALPRAVMLGGFRDPALNAFFVERWGPEWAVFGRSTLWTTGEAAGRLFLYFDAAHNAWAAARAEQLSAVQGGLSQCIAMAPAGDDIWDAGAPKEGPPWREWDERVSAWASRPRAGVKSCGKARPRDLTQEAAVQATPELRDQGCQTEKVLGEDIVKLWTRQP